MGFCFYLTRTFLALGLTLGTARSMNGSRLLSYGSSKNLEGKKYVRLQAKCSVKEPRSGALFLFE